MQTIAPFTAFSGTCRLASGDLPEVALSVKALLEQDSWAPALIFDNQTGLHVEVDLRGTREDVLERLAPPPGVASPEDEAVTVPRGPGRPKLGVVAREITLLPRHWEWLATQPGGASVAVRKLVEEARRTNTKKDRLREAREAVYRFISATAGNEPGFEEVSRALFAGDKDRFMALMKNWPGDVREHALAMGAEAFDT